MKSDTMRRCDKTVTLDERRSCGDYDRNRSHQVLYHLGWVLAWLGLWFPLDQFLFYPLEHSREERALALLRDAEVVVQTYRPAPSAVT